MKILQFNIQSINNTNNKDILELYLDRYDIDIALICETWLRDNSSTSMLHYNFAFKNRDDGYGGVGIYLKKSISFSMFYVDGEGETVGISTLNLKRNFNIIVTYIAPSTSVTSFQTSIKNIVDMTRKFKTPTLIAGDMNAKATLWGNPEDDRKGEFLAEIMDQSNFICLNNGEPTFGTNNLRTSAIDVSFFNGNRCNPSWKVSNVKLTSSNHYPITIEIFDQDNTPRNVKKVCRRKVLREIQSLRVGNSIEEFTGDIHSIVQNNTIQIESRNRYCPKGWWDEEASRLFRLRTAARHVYYRSRTLQNCLALEETDTAFNRHIRNLKRSNFQTLIDEITTGGPDTMWKSIKNVRKYGMNKDIRDSWNADQNTQFLDIIGKSIAAPIAPPSVSAQTLTLHGTSDLVESTSHTVAAVSITAVSLSDLHFEFHDFVRFLNSRSLKSAAGPDKISYEMLRELSPVGKLCFFNILQEIWMSGVIPDIWRDVRIKPIPKRGKDLTKVDNYRPISLMSVPLKIVEGLIKINIQKQFERPGVLPDRSYAFRPGRSTSMCINDMVNLIYQLKSSSYHVLGMCIDVEKAYDSTNKDKLVLALRSYNVDDHAINWIDSFLGRRTLRLGKQSITISNGLAQGSGLSPLLFNIYTAVLHDINSEACTLFQYADDFFILAYDRDFVIARDIMETKVAEFRRRCLDLDLRFNPDKTNAIHFNRRRRALDIRVDNTAVREVDCIKYLGLTIASNNSTKDHVANTVSAIGRRSNFLKILSGCNFGIDPRKALLLYKSIIRSKIEYASSTFSNMGDTYVRKLRTCANDFLRRALGLIRSTPIPIIYHMAAEMPPAYRFELSTAKEIAKCMTFGYPASSTLRTFRRPVNTSYYKTYQRHKDIFENMALASTSTPEAVRIRIVKDFFHGAVTRKAEANIEVVQRLFNEKMASLTNQGFELFFTDGSVRAETTGAAFVHHDSGTVYAFYDDKRLSSMTAELMAIVKATEHARDKGMPMIAILTDSLSGIQALESDHHGHFLVDVFRRLAAEIPFGVELHFIPGHSGIRLNEIVDQAAKRAKEFGTHWNIPWPLGDAIKSIEERIWSSWTTEYEESARGGNSHYYRIHPTTRRTLWFKDVNLKPTDCKSLNRILSGHCYCNVTLARFKVVPSTLCDTCATDETASHIIFRCTKFETLRSQFPKLLNAQSIEHFVELYGIAELSTLTDFLAENEKRL